MKPKMSALQSGFISGIQAVVIALLLCYGLMFLVERLEPLQQLDQQITSYNSHGVVQMDVMPNGADLLGLALQMPYTVTSGSMPSRIESEGLNIQVKLHMLWLLAIPVLAFYCSTKRKWDHFKTLEQLIIYMVSQSAAFTSMLMGLMAVNQKKITFPDLPSSGLSLSGYFNLLEGSVICFVLAVLIQCGLYWHMHHTRQKAQGQIVVENERPYLYAKYVATMALIALIANIGLAVFWFYTQMNGQPLIELSLLGSNAFMAIVGLVLIVGFYYRFMRKIKEKAYWRNLCLFTGWITITNCLSAYLLTQQLSIEGSLNILRFIGIYDLANGIVMGIQLNWLEIIVFSVLLPLVTGALVFAWRRRFKPAIKQ